MRVCKLFVNDFVERVRSNGQNKGLLDMSSDYVVLILSIFRQIAKIMEAILILFKMIIILLSKIFFIVYSVFLVGIVTYFVCVTLLFGPYIYCKERPFDGFCHYKDIWYIFLKINVTETVAYFYLE